MRIRSSVLSALPYQSFSSSSVSGSSSRSGTVNRPFQRPGRRSGTRLPFLISGTGHGLQLHGSQLGIADADILAPGCALDQLLEMILGVI